MLCFGPKDRKRLKTNHCVIVLLDDTQLVHELHPSTTGQDLLDVVFKHLNLLETSYFGLKYLPARQQDASALANAQSARPQAFDSTSGTNATSCWLDMDKSAIKQLKGAHPMTVYFGVKFYASDPCKLAEEITRYQFFLQCKQDILQAKLVVSFALSIELFGLAIQSELGDYDPERHLEGYVSEFQFAPQQSLELEQAASFYHRQLSGQVPATAELNFLERVKWLDMYGCQLHPIQYDEGERGDQYALGLNPSGVLVLRNRLKVAQYLWARIVKTKCQGRCFLMDVIDIEAQSAISQQQLVKQQQQQQQRLSESKRNRFGFRLADKEASRRLRWSIEEHKSFYFLINSTLGRRHQQQQDAANLLQQQQQQKFGQRFRQSIRSAMSATGHPYYLSQQQQQQLYAEQKLRSSVKLLQQQQQQRQQPTVVRMPSRRYGLSTRSLQRPFVYQQQQQQQQANGNGLPVVVSLAAPPPPLMPPPAAPHHKGGAHTMVDSQRQQALIMMQQMQQQQQHHYHHQQMGQQYSLGANFKSHTLRPSMSKDKRKLHYQQQMMVAAALAQQQQQQQQQPALALPEISVVPPGQHIVQPSVYRATSVLEGVNQLGGKVGDNNDLLIRQNPATMMQQLFAGHHHHHQTAAPLSRHQRARSGHESPRSTKSAIAPSSALKLAAKKLAKQQQKEEQQHYRQYLGAGDMLPPPQNYSNSFYGAQSGSPRTSRRLARQRSKSTGENLHLVVGSAAVRQQQLQLPAPTSSLLLSTTAPVHRGGPTSLPPPDYNSSSTTPTRTRRHIYSPDNELKQSHSAVVATNVQQQQHQQPHRRGSKLAKTGDKKQRQLSGGEEDDDDYYCSRSDCSSVDELGSAALQSRGGQQRQARFINGQLVNSGGGGGCGQQVALEKAADWNAIKRRHNEFSNGKGLLGQLEARNNPCATKQEMQQQQQQQHDQQQLQQNNGLRLDANNNNSSKHLVGGNATGSSNLVKNITNKQATPILLSMSHHFDQQQQQHQLSNDLDNSKAVQLLNMQRQQLNSASSDGTNTTTATTTTSTTSSKGMSNSSSSNPSSVSSSPKATAAAGQQQQLVRSNLNNHQAEGSTASNNSTTSGYYAGSNSTGPASVDSYTIDSLNTVQKHNEWQRQPSGATEERPTRIAPGRGGRLVIGGAGQQSRASRPEQFYLGENKSIDCEGNNNNSLHESKPTNVQIEQQQQQKQLQQHWSPLDQLQQHSASSLKYVSFDV